MKLNYNENIIIKTFSRLDDIVNETSAYLNEGNVGLSGGSTYLELLKKWSNRDLDLTKTNFYPVDERVVPFDSEFSNWGNSYRYFLSKYRKNRDHHFTDKKSYNEKLANVVIDKLFLGVGDDGHTASLFTLDSVFKDKDTKVIDSISPKEPKNRISLTGNYIIKSGLIIIIFLGDGKENILNKVINGDDLPITKLLKKVKNGIIYIHEPLLGDQNE